MDEKRPVLRVRDLTVSFSMYDRGWKKKSLEVIHSLDVEVMPGEIVAVAGSSGSGKSVLAHSILGILPQNASVKGKIEYMGQPLTEEGQRKLRGREIAFIPQSVDFLDPLMKVGRQIKGIEGSDRRLREVMELYGLKEETADLYPFQLSGGMARRAMIASAMMGTPKLIVADEPTPGLDTALSENTLKSFRHLADGGCGILLITHDIDLALGVADRIAVFYAGTTVEVCPAGDFDRGGEMLRHPYSRALAQAMPQNGLKAANGSQPYAGNLPSGCLFADRCPLRTEKCGGEIPMREVRGGKVRCLYGA